MGCLPYQLVQQVNAGCLNHQPLRLFKNQFVVHTLRTRYLKSCSMLLGRDIILNQNHTTSSTKLYNHWSRCFTPEYSITDASYPCSFFIVESNYRIFRNDPYLSSCSQVSKEQEYFHGSQCPWDSRHLEFSETLGHETEPLPWNYTVVEVAVIRCLYVCNHASMETANIHWHETELHRNHEHTKHNENNNSPVY